MKQTGPLAAMEAAEADDPAARARLFVGLYEELHGIARRELQRNSAMTLSPTTLLHETFLNISQRESASFDNRSQFIVYVARAMRGLVIDYLRMRQAHKRGGEYEITPLPTETSLFDEGNVQMEELGSALEWLAQVDESLAECVDLKFFCGFSFSEIAELRGVSERTVLRHWNKARVLLHRFLSNEVTAADSVT